jgi:hypothetical protein
VGGRIIHSVIQQHAFAVGDYIIKAQLSVEIADADFVPEERIMSARHYSRT